MGDTWLETETSGFVRLSAIDSVLLDTRTIKPGYLVEAHMRSGKSFILKGTFDTPEEFGKWWRKILSPKQLNTGPK